MFKFARRSTSLVLLLLLPAAAQAQYNPYYPGYGGGYGGYMQGAASVINAQGTYANQMEQARIMREQANQAKLDTKRKTFDEMNYEKANTPTLLDQMEYTEAQKVRRVMFKPLDAEVRSGQAQNIMLPYLRTMSSQGIQGPPVQLEPGVLKQVNVTVGNKGNLGVLKDPTALQWPEMLIGPKQEKVTDLMGKAVGQANKGKLDPKLYRELKIAVEDLKSDLVTRFKQEKIDGGTYIRGKRFLEPIESGLIALAEPGAAKFLDGSYAARGRTVQELVSNMSQQGLTFTDVTPGNEPAYYSLLNSMVAYANGVQSTGFQTRLPPQTQKR